MRPIINVVTKKVTLAYFTQKKGTYVCMLRAYIEYKKYKKF